MLTIMNRQRKVALDIEAIRPRLEAAMTAARASGKEVTLVFVSDRAIRRLNRIWRGVDRPTDCLSFPAREGEGAEFAGSFLGDVVISLETAAAQARDDRGPGPSGLEEEVVFLFVHSLLHLLGYDHGEPDAAARMESRARALLRAAGASVTSPVPPPGSRG